MEALAKILFLVCRNFPVYGGGKWSSDNYLCLKRECRKIDFNIYYLISQMPINQIAMIKNALLALMLLPV